MGIMLSGKHGEANGSICNRRWFFCKSISLFINKGQNYWALIGWERGHFFLIEGIFSNQERAWWVLGLMWLHIPSGLARSEALSRKYRRHCNYSCKVLFAELSPIFESIKKTECVSISVSLVWQLGTVSELQHREDGLSNHDFAALKLIFRSMRAVQILRALHKSDIIIFARNK